MMARTTMSRGRGIMAGGGKGRGQGGMADEYGEGSYGKRYIDRNNAKNKQSKGGSATIEKDYIQEIPGQQNTSNQPTFEDCRHVEVSVVKNKRTGQQQDADGGRGQGVVGVDQTSDQGFVAGQYGRGSFDKRFINRSNANKNNMVDSVSKKTTKEDIQPAFEVHEHVKVPLVKKKRTWQQQDVGRGRGKGFMGVDQSSGQAVMTGVGRGRGRDGEQGSVLGSTTDAVRLQSEAHQHTMMSSHVEGSDGGDVSSVQVTSTRRGSASQVQVPEPLNRPWIHIKNGEFSNQIRSTRVIGSTLKSMWSGPWESWKDIPNDVKKRLFERFQCYFQWEEKWNAEIYTCWEQCIAGKIPNMLTRVRDGAKAMAESKGLVVEDDMSVLIDYKPAWIKMETWKQMIEIWNTPKWKEKSERNTKIRNESKGGKHTLGSQTYVTAKRKVAMILGREPSHSEMWKQSHLRKGSRPFDKDPSASSSVGENINLEDVDLDDAELEENLPEKELAWVDERAHETLDKYEKYLVEEYGEECSQQPKFDRDLWFRAVGGKKKGKVYGLGNVSDPYVQDRQDHEIERLNIIIQELVKEKEEEKERLNQIIAGLVMEKEKDKAEKEALNGRMENIEAMLKARF